MSAKGYGCSRQWPGWPAQFQPLAGAVGIEPGGIELAAVQVLVAHRQAVGRRGVRRVPGRGRDPLVDVLGAGVVALVDGQRLAGDRGGKRRRFMRKSTQRGALAGRLRLVVGVDLDDVAHGVHLVAVVVRAVGGHTRLTDVPAHVPVVTRDRRLPAVPAGRALVAAITLERGDALVVAARGIVGRAAREVAGPVLFPGQQRAPRRLAGAAVVQRAACGGAGGRVPGLQQRMASCRTVKLDRRVLVDAEVERRVRYHTEPATGLADLEDGDAVNRQFLVDFRRQARQARGAAVGMQVVGRGVAGAVVGGRLVVHADQRAVAAGRRGRPGGRQAEVLHAVVVVTETVLVVPVGAVVPVGGGGGTQRVTQRVDDRKAVALRNRHLVGQRLADRRETQRTHGGGVRITVIAAATRQGGQRNAAEQRHGARRDAHAQHVATVHACCKNTVERKVGGIVAADVVGVLPWDARAHGAS
jgi:hypothetical protein